MATPKTDRETFAVDAIPSDTKSSIFLGTPILDNVVSSMIAMGAELWATKRRLKVVEAVMAEKGVTAEMIEQYTPSEAQNTAWEADRDRFIDMAFGPLANPGTLKVSSEFPKRGS